MRGGVAAVAAACVIAAAGCVRDTTRATDSRATRIAQLAEGLRQGDPWPAIRDERIRTLLPQRMEAAGIDAWVLFCRENNNDPLAKHVGCEDAGRFAAVLFLLHGGIAEEIVIASDTEADSYRDALPHARVLTSNDESAVFAELPRSCMRLTRGDRGQ